MLGGAAVADRRGVIRIIHRTSERSFSPTVGPARCTKPSVEREGSILHARRRHGAHDREVNSEAFPRSSIVTLLLPIIHRWYEEDDPPPLSHTPKPGGAMEGCRLLEVLYDNRCGRRTGALGDRGEA
jgi:hypothetical protein